MNKLKKFFTTLTMILICVGVFSVSVAAVYTSGDLNTNRYYSPLRFDFEILGTTAQLTPTISYASGSPLTYDTFEEATQPASPNIITSINRRNFQVSAVGATCVDVSYRLSFDVTESTDNFTMRITAPGGIYDFLKYGVPEIAIPTGYTVEAAVSYNVRFTQDQTNTSVLTDYVQYNSSYSGNSNFPLIRSTYRVNGVDYNIVGGVLVNDYVATLTFTKAGSSGTGVYGDAGWYLFDSVLSYPGETIEEQLTVDSYFTMYCDEPVYVAGLNNGVAYEEEIYAIIFDNSFDDLSDLDLLYEIAYTNTGVLVYDYATEEWQTVDHDLSSDTIVLTPTTIRYLHFTDTYSNTFGLSNSDERAFFDWFSDNTIYYSSNPLTIVSDPSGTGYSFTDGDGGMYLHYYCDRMLDEEISATYADFYGYGYSNGLANGDGDFSEDYGSWIGTAVGGFMNLELFPNFSIGGVLSTIVGLCLLIVFLKFFAGG